MNQPCPSGDQLDTGEFWAVRDVSFQIGAGDGVGLIGPNGAGKSTILKLLTRILRPTHGHCRIQGRVGVLIEAAAGYHPDLTGRKNIFLQGAIMGMSRREIVRKFDEIVAFSVVEWFLDTPVMRYFSDMHTLLGFSIPAHLDPDMLIIDEALAVGDAAFQRKAVDRISELVRGDIPLVLVSHQLETIASLCNQAILIGAGGGGPAGHARGVHHRLRRREGGGAAAGECADGDRHPPAAARTGGSGAVRGTAGMCPAMHRLRARHGGLGERGHPHPLQPWRRPRLRDQRAGARPGAASQWPHVRLELRLNVPPGIYPVESFVWNRMAGRQLAAGPVGAVEVRGGPGFHGIVQMNPPIRVAREDHP